MSVSVARMMPSSRTARTLIHILPPAYVCAPPVNCHGPNVSVRTGRAATDRSGRRGRRPSDRTPDLTTGRAGALSAPTRDTSALRSVSRREPSFRRCARTSSHAIVGGVECLTLACPRKRKLRGPGDRAAPDTVDASQVDNRGRRLAQPFAGPTRLTSMMAPMQLPRRGRTRIEFERFVDGCAGELLRTGYLIV
jgi:hypothetical protein